MSAPRRYDRDLAAQIIMEAIELNLPIYTALAELMDISANQARHLIAMVRDDGLLGNRPHFPARAYISKASTREKTWLVCEDCLTHWPCRFAYPYGPADQRKTGAENSAVPKAAKSRRRHQRAAQRRARADASRTRPAEGVDDSDVGAAV